MNTYKAFFKNKQIEVKADTSYQAQTKAAEIFKTKKNWDITVVLIAKEDKEVLVSPCSLPGA